MDKNYVQKLRPHVIAVKRALKASDSADDARALSILVILIAKWECPTDAKITQQEFAEMVTGIGHHLHWESHLGGSIETTVRKIRGLIEKVLRKRFTLPILSTPGQDEIKGAGYWLARTKAEAIDYVERREKEIAKTNRSALSTLAAVRRVCMVDGAGEVESNGSNKFDVKHCARCGEDHAKLKFTKLTLAGARHSHWAMCPVNAEPIMLRIVPEGGSR